MKKIIILLAVFFIQKNAIAQTPIFWFENGTTWVHTISTAFGWFGYMETKVYGEQIVNGVLCKKFQRHYKTYDTSNGMSLIASGSAPDLYMYATNNGQQVYIYNSNKYIFELLYDFTKVSGNTVTYPYPENVDLSTFCPNNTYSVVNNGLTNINGQNLKYYSLEVTSNTNYEFTGKLLERIGSQEFYFHSLVSDNPSVCLSGNGDMNFVSYFRCFKDSSLNYKSDVVNSSFAGNCYFPGPDLNLGVKSTNKVKNEFSIYPNPGNTTVTITKNNNSNSEIKVYNTVGQLVAVHKIMGRQKQIDVSQLQAGIYYFSLDGVQKSVIISH